MKRKAVKSSNLLSVGYDHENEVLEVEFHSGRVYHYYDVSQETYEGLITADSHGRYFNSHIRDEFLYDRVR